jgi:hypothetical protein
MFAVVKAVAVEPPALRLLQIAAGAAVYALLIVAGDRESRDLLGALARRLLR